ncbi:MAG: RAMP superfamily CRISPR-associated protein, partial [Anaerovorax sp.]
AFEFYMEKPARNPPTWTYDFYGDGDRPENIINGRKFYWHFTPKQKKVSKTNRNATMESAIKGTEFAFKVYFNNITSDELEILKTAITLGENDSDSNLCHKLGHGKPLGYGSVKLTIEGQTERTLAFSKELGEIQYRTMKTENINVECIDAQNNPSLLKIVDLTTIKEGVNVCYPLGEDSTSKNQNVCSGPLQWFIGNKGGFANNPDIDMVLPKISDEKITLPKLRKTEEKQTNAESTGTQGASYRNTRNQGGSYRNARSQDTSHKSTNESTLATDSLQKCKTPGCEGRPTRQGKGWTSYCPSCYEKIKKAKENKDK